MGAFATTARPGKAADVDHLRRSPKDKIAALACARDSWIQPLAAGDVLVNHHAGCAAPSLFASRLSSSWVRLCSCAALWCNTRSRHLCLCVCWLGCSLLSWLCLTLRLCGCTPAPTLLRTGHQLILRIKFSFALCSWAALSNSTPTRLAEDTLRTKGAHILEARVFMLSLACFLCAHTASTFVHASYCNSTCASEHTCCPRKKFYTALSVCGDACPKPWWVCSRAMCLRRCTQKPGLTWQAVHCA